ncbi:MAG: GlsB/YeaQ/YmgE family stress response membrane protein [Anaerolineae bacterium]|nr:GlsB/YeaQ/YmgE family stress response membrane protein [Anaerolineae bacterium]NUQ05591.1 GlsB/YeaQ/YmgE family stress response membrane protein [Anaerolineae bacterium]
MGIVLIILIVLGAIFLFSIMGSILDLVIALAVWAVIGWAAGKLVRGQGYGALGNILLGLVGGVVGGILFGLIGWSSVGLIGSILSGVVGGVIVVYAARLLGR